MDEHKKNLVKEAHKAILTTGKVYLDHLMPFYSLGEMFLMEMSITEIANECEKVSNLLDVLNERATISPELSQATAKAVYIMKKMVVDLNELNFKEMQENVETLESLCKVGLDLLEPV